MKKLLLLAVAVFTLSACEGDKYYECDCEGDGLYMHSLDIASRPSTWALMDGRYFKTTVDYPQLTNFVYKYGQISVYLYLDEGEVQIALPCTRYFSEDNNGNPRNWSQTIDYEYTVGELNLFVTDINYNPGKPDYNFRAVLTW